MRSNLDLEGLEIDEKEAERYLLYIGREDSGVSPLDMPSWRENVSSWRENVSL